MAQKWKNGYNSNNSNNSNTNNINNTESSSRLQGGGRSTSQQFQFKASAFYGIAAPCRSRSRFGTLRVRNEFVRVAVRVAVRLAVRMAAVDVEHTLAGRLAWAGDRSGWLVVRLSRLLLLVRGWVV